MDNKKTPFKIGPHFAGPKPGEFFAVAPGMRFRDKDGKVTIIPPPKQEEKKT